MISEAVLQLCQVIRQAGGRALLVGGWVRDFARGPEHLKASVDYDIEVYGLEAAALRALLDGLGKVDAVGEAFTVYKVRLREAGKRSFVVDVSLPRRESKTGRGHRGFVVEGDPQMSFAEASRRRDFTINAMMYDPLAGEYIDVYGGQADLQRGIIRVVDPNTFIEDSLRVLRAMQFAARFEFTIDAATVALCRSIDLSDLPAERVWAEVEKWLFAARPSIGLHAARELGITEKLWPEIDGLAGCPQDPTVHPEGDVFVHTGLVLDEARKLMDGLPRPKQLALMLGALCHDLGKPVTTMLENGKVRAAGHEAASVALTERFLDRLKLFTFDGYDVRKQTLALVKHHAVPHRWGRAHKAGGIITDGMFRRLALEVEPELLYRVARADCLGRTGDFTTEFEDWFLSRVRELGIEQQAPAALLLGRHVLALGLPPGPRVGDITRAVYERQLDGEIVTLDEAIAAARRMIE